MENHSWLCSHLMQWNNNKYHKLCTDSLNKITTRMDKTSETYFTQFTIVMCKAVHPIPEDLRHKAEKWVNINEAVDSYIMPREHMSRFSQQGKMNKQCPWKKWENIIPKEAP